MTTRGLAIDLKKIMQRALEAREWRQECKVYDDPHGVLFLLFKAHGNSAE